jgi:HEPN domain-containing protein
MPLQNEDFLSASVRHYNDSTHLYAKGRLDNAAYLAGYVVECGLKAVLQVYGHGVRAYGHDIAALHGQALDLATVLSPGSSRYRPDRISSLACDMSAWKPEMRYHQTGMLTRADAERIMKAARDVFDSVVSEMALDNGGLRL